jgi:cyanophycin synthetase
VAAAARLCPLRWATAPLVGLPALPCLRAASLFPADPSFADSRRLTGPNRHFAVPAAVLEGLAGPDLDDGLPARWRHDVELAARHLGWAAPRTDVRRNPAGALFAMTAPADQLYTATEVNEWAWQRASRHDDGFHAPGYAAIRDEALALETLRRYAVAERNPRLLALRAAAERAKVPLHVDDEVVSLGEGRGRLMFAADALPDLQTLDWTGLHRIPKIAVTGSNGKTTSVRLLARLWRAAGLRTGHSCTDGLYIDGQLIEAGDFSGPAGARSILRREDVEAAVLETARGGILRRGLGLGQADVALVTNVSADHFGEYGVYSLDDLAEVKLSVAHLIADDGVLVLNADDDSLVRHAANLHCRIAWFALRDEHPILEAHRSAGGATCAVREGELVLNDGRGEYALGAVADMPLSVGGIARYNIANLAGAALCAFLAGIPLAGLAEVLTHFGANREDNSGRLQRWNLGGIVVLLDYAHNPEGLDGFLTIARHAQHGRLGLLLGQAGNRDDADVRQLAIVAARHRPDRIVLKDIAGYMRGRVPGEIAEILRAALIAADVSTDALLTLLDEVEAARSLLQWARAGDVVALPVHASAARSALTSLLNRMEVEQWNAGEPVPETIRPAAGSTNCAS